MFRLLLLCGLLLTGCNTIRGPAAPRKDKLDDPLLSIPEQQRRAANSYPLPIDSPAIGPRTDVGKYGPTNR